MVEDFDTAPAGVQKCDGVPRPPAWWHRPLFLWGDRCANAFVLSSFMCVAVTLGTALGNGLPLMRSTQEAFKMGIQTGLAKCPCGQKSPTPVVAAATKKPDVKTADHKVVELVPVPDAGVTVPVKPREPKEVFKPGD